MIYHVSEAMEMILCEEISFWRNFGKNHQKYPIFSDMSVNFPNILDGQCGSSPLQCLPPKKCL